MSDTFDKNLQLSATTSSTSNGSALTVSTNGSGNGIAANGLHAVVPYRPQTQLGMGAPQAIHGLRRRWPQMVGAGIVTGIILAGVAWFMFQPKFQTYATLRVHSEPPRLAFDLTESEQAAQFEVYKRTQKELVLGDEVLLAALRNAKLSKSPQFAAIRQDNDPVIWLRKQLRVDFPGNAEIMSISMQGDNGSFITEAVNAVLDAYVENVVDVGKQHRSNRLAELRKVLSIQEEKVRRLRSKLQSLTESLGSGDTDALSVKQQVAIQQLAQLQSELGRIRLERQRAELNLKRKNSASPSVVQPELTLDSAAATGLQLGALSLDPSLFGSPKPAQPEMAVQEDPAVVAQRAVVTQAILDLERAKAVSPSEKNRMLIPYEAKVQKEMKVLEALEQSVRQSPALKPSQTIVPKSESAQETEQLLVDVEALRLHEETLEKSLAEASAAADKIGTSSVNVELTRKELDRLETINDKISVEIETLTIELSSASRVEPLSRARQPQAPSQQERFKRCAAFGVFGFLLPCAGLLWLDSRRKLINGEVEVSQASTLPILGSVPLVRQVNRPAEGQNRDVIALREAVDRIRTVLLREAELADYRVIQITSSIAGEAKTTVACQLAKSIARAHRRTILVDFDLRRPSVHEAFALPLENGICELLRGELSVDDVVRSTEQQNLSLITAGRCDRFALEGLTKGLVGDVINSLREQFEFVIIESSPVLPVVDALIVAQRVDATILTALRDVSSGPQLREAQERLRQVGVHVAGTVVTTKSDNWYGQTVDRYAVV